MNAGEQHAVHPASPTAPSNCKAATQDREQEQAAKKSWQVAARDVRSWLILRRRAQQLSEVRCGTSRSRSSLHQEFVSLALACHFTRIPDLAPNGPTLYTHLGIPAHYFFLARHGAGGALCPKASPKLVTAALPSVCQTHSCSVWVLD